MNDKELTYEAAVEELNEIVQALEQEITSIDQLSEKVKRAAELVQFCKEKLRVTEQDVQNLLDSSD